MCNCEMGECRTIRAGVIAADTQSFCVALDVFVVEFDPKGPTQIRLPNCVLQPPSSICKPVGHLKKEGGCWNGTEERMTIK